MPPISVEYECDFPNCKHVEKMRERDYANRGWSSIGTHRLCPDHADVTRREFVGAVNVEFQLASAD